MFKVSVSTNKNQPFLVENLVNILGLVKNRIDDY